MGVDVVPLGARAEAQEGLVEKQSKEGRAQRHEGEGLAHAKQVSNHSGLG